MLSKIILGTLVALVLIGCSSVSVTDDYNPETDFNIYKTFSIHSGLIKESKLETMPLIKQRVHDAITAEMIKKGMSLDESGNADIIIFAHAGTKEKISVAEYGGRWRTPFARNIDVNTYTEGALIIDFISKADNELKWRGVGSTVIHEKESPEKRVQSVNEVVSKILEQYPPQE